LHLPDLEARVKAEGVQEVIIALDPDVEGEVTTNYLADRLHGVTVSRPATGIPAGGALQYADTVTLARALQGRRQV
jgi:recombination protein RecR